MSREFTKREKVLILVLVILSITVGYLKLILEPINDQISEYSRKQLDEQVEIDQKTIQVRKLREMEAAIREMKENGQYQEIPTYDNINAVIEELHAVLASAIDYSLDFKEQATTDYIVARPVAMEFTAPSYTVARDIIDRLSESGNFNLISDLSITWDKLGLVSVSLRITYYEVKVD